MGWSLTEKKSKVSQPLEFMALSIMTVVTSGISCLMSLLTQPRPSNSKQKETLTTLSCFYWAFVKATGAILEGSELTGRFFHFMPIS